MMNDFVFIYPFAKKEAAERFALPALGRGRRSRPTGKMLRRRKLLEIAADSPASGARFVGQFLALRLFCYDKRRNTSGFCSAIRNNATAGPLGLRLPCSQS